MQEPILPNAYRMPASEVVAALDSDAARGLTTAEARARLERFGRNTLQSAPSVPTWRKLLAQFESPLTLLLLAATAISLLVWFLERESALPYEALTILAIVLFNAALGFVQEARAEQAVSNLQQMAAAMARVIRDGESRTVPAEEIVPGDLLRIEEGDTIPADARLLETVALQTTEAALTGESAPVLKTSAPLTVEADLGDRVNMVFSGSSVTYGHGKAVVTATGMQTEMGQIAGLLHQTVDASTPLQKELDHVGKRLGLAVIGIAVVISAVILLLLPTRTLASLVSVLLLAVSLAVAAVPEGLTAITTIVLSLGMERMAKRHVIVRRLAAVETLGSATTICSDKTGTLTRNEMTVRAILTASGRVDFTGIGYDPAGAALQNGAPVTDSALQSELERLLLAGFLANNATLQPREEGWRVDGDPTEGALKVAAIKAGLDPAHLEARFGRIGEIPFSSDRKMMSTAHTDAERKERVLLLSKGAPDVLLSRCAFERIGAEARPLTPERREAILAAVEQMAGEGLRTLGAAYRTLQPDTPPDALSEHLEQEFVWLGLIGMTDPPRPEARDAVQRARRAGIRVLLITGDHPRTAAAIAAELGILDKETRAVTGAQLQQMTPEQLRQVTREVSVYARVSPEHKLRIVEALQANGAIVAMTGDGVNDAPALKRADIGVAMGLTGTDVAKSAADMILTDDNFASIVAAIEEGRAIFANIQKFLRYLLSSNIGEVLTMFFGVVLAGVIGLTTDAPHTLALPLLATMILWINLLTDSGPALALGLDPVDPIVMERPPRDPHSRIITRPMWQGIFFVGAIMAAGTLFVLDLALPGGLVAGDRDLTEARSMAFTTLVLFQLFNVFNARSDTRSAFRRLFQNGWLWAALLLSLGLQFLVIYAPPLQRAFSTSGLTAQDWLICAAVASSALWLRELEKLARRHLLQRTRQECAGPSVAR